MLPPPPPLRRRELVSRKELELDEGVLSLLVCIDCGVEML